MAKKKLSSIIWPNLPNDTYILDAGKVEFDNTASYDADTVGKELQKKADASGAYPDLTAGTANQINSSVRVTDKTPYIFRTSGGSVDIGDREYVNGIVGGTVAWNQQTYGVEYWAASSMANASISDGVMSGTATAQYGQFASTYTHEVEFINGHKYLALVQGKTDATGEYGFYYIADNTFTKYCALTTAWKEFAIIFNHANATVKKLPVVYDGHTSGWQKIYAKNPQIFDLTQMFGSAIADYIYSLEQGTAGAGVAWFKKLFPKPYYAYNAGELKSVSGLVSHDMTGFNQWDEEYQIGYYDTVNGAYVSSNSWNCTKNGIKCLPNTNYYFKIPKGYAQSFGALLFYDADGNYLGYRSDTGNIWNHVITTPDNCYLMQYYAASGWFSGVTEPACINLAWDNSRNGEYEPYEKHSYPLDSDITLRGLFKLDANNNLYADGDIYPPSGEVSRRYSIVDLGALNYNKYDVAQGTLFRAVITGIKQEPDSLNLMCPLYTTVGVSSRANGTISKTTGEAVDIINNSYSDATAFKTAMSGVYLVYELATPTTETADPYTSPQIVNDFGTEEYVVSDSVFAVPVGHDTDYPINMVAKLEMAPNSPSGDGDYIVRQTNGTNEYVSLAGNATIQDIISRLEALENA